MPLVLERVPVMAGDLSSVVSIPEVARDRPYVYVLKEKVIAALYKVIRVPPCKLDRQTVIRDIL